MKYPLTLRIPAASLIEIVGVFEVALPSSVLKVEELDIAVEHEQILADLGSGDFTKQRHACGRLVALAENHYPDFLPSAIALISDANQLQDRIRDRVIVFDERGVETRQLILSAVELLRELKQATPVGRLSYESMSADDKARSDRLASRIEREIQSNASPAGANRNDMSDEDMDIIRFIVQTQDPNAKGKLLAAEDITRSYRGSSFKLRPISLELNRGEILGIVGVNASGKTTLLRLLIGDLKPDHGELSYPCFETSDKKPGWLSVKRRIGYVSQTLPRWPGSVYENLWYVASIYGRSANEIREHLDLLLRRYGLDKFKDATWDEISGGYKTRFEIVRALLGRPDILVLDEPLAYLDIISQQVVLRQLRQLAKNRARPIGIIITSQQLYEIEAIADRLLVLEGGSTCFTGRIADLARQIDDLVIEFDSTGPMTAIKEKLALQPSYRSMFSTETGYIAVFKRENGQQSETGAQFNSVIEILGRECPGHLAYVRDISNSSRILFEPQMARWLSAKRT